MEASFRDVNNNPAESLGMTCTQNNAQRTYYVEGGPWSTWEYGCEVIVRNFPTLEHVESLLKVCQEWGRVRQLRLMIRYDNTNKGNVYILYENTQEAQKAILGLKGRIMTHSITKTQWQLDIGLSQDNRTIFLGRIPKMLTKNQIQSDIQTFCRGLKKVQFHNDWLSQHGNRGFCFLHFESHELASEAKISLSQRLPETWGTSELKVHWAAMETFVPKEVMEKVTSIFIRGLRLETTAEEVRMAVSAAVRVGVMISDVRKDKDFAFVSLGSRKLTETAIQLLNGKLIDGAEVEVQLKKPQKYLEKQLREQLKAKKNYISINRHDFNNNLLQQPVPELQKMDSSGSLHHADIPFLENGVFYTSSDTVPQPLVLRTCTLHFPSGSIDASQLSEPPTMNFLFPQNGNIFNPSGVSNVHTQFPFPNDGLPDAPGVREPPAHMKFLFPQNGNTFNPFGVSNVHTQFAFPNDGSPDAPGVREPPTHMKFLFPENSSWE